MSRKTIVPFGPQHPVLPEPIHLKLVLEDEKVIEAIPAIGYIHRGLEKLAEQKDFNQNVFLMERICGICSFIHSMAYSMGLEELLAIEIPVRAKYLRVIWSELNRLHSHLLWAGLLADSFGYENLFMQLWRLREAVLDMSEATTGGRVMYGTCAIGGVRKDLSSEHQTEMLHLMDRLEKGIVEVVDAMKNDYSVKERLVNVGTITNAQAHSLGAVGPVARACGIETDLRMMGYAVYGELGVKPMVETGGDCYARTMVRMRELTQSIELIRKAIAAMPQGPISVPVKGNPNGEAIIRVEQPRGEVLYYFNADGSKNMRRVRVRTPTFANIAPLLHMLPGCQLADVPVIVLSIDPCISCTER